MSNRASYDLKLDRAEKHLVEIEDLVSGYEGSHPYAVSTSIEGQQQRETHRLRFTDQPSSKLSLVVGDFVYNLRSALDHIRSALVPKNRERKGYFPIYFPGVWEEPVEGENVDRTKARARWRTDTKGVHPDALTILKRVQRHAALDEKKSPPALTLLNRIAIKDRHTKLPVVAIALAEVTGTCRRSDGVVYTLPTWSRLEGLSDGAKIGVPDGAVDVQIQGTPVVVVRVTDGQAIRIPKMLREVILPGIREIIDDLRPYARDR